MKNIINNTNINEVIVNENTNLQNAIKVSILNIISCNYEEILYSNKFSKDDLDSFSYEISEDSELNDVIDNLIYRKLDEFINKDNIQCEEEL